MTLALALSLALATNVRAETRPLHTTNSAGRTGAVYAPPGAGSRALPLMIVFHGTGGDGRQMIDLLRAQADENGFVILAPDSRRSPDGEFTWQVGVRPTEVTEDLTHTIACLDELEAMSDVVIDKTQVIAVGYSGGGSLAPYIASRESRINAFAVLHGGAFAGGLGPRRPRGWFSTGEADSERPPSAVQADLRSLSSLFGPLEWRTFAGGHELSADEQRALVKWWLDGAHANSAASASRAWAGEPPAPQGPSAKPARPAPRPQAPDAHTLTPGTVESVDFNGD